LTNIVFSLKKLSLKKLSLKKLSLAVVFPAPLGLSLPKQKKRKNGDNFLPKGRPCGSFSGPFGACHKCPKGPGTNKKKEKIGTIFCPKGGLAVRV
jgi:hypothetical protein